MRPRPLNAVRAFEASARHLSFTRAAHELNVTQAAVSQQARALEVRLGTPRFRRLPRGLGVTDEGRALLPVLSDAFGRIEAVLKQFEGGHFHDVLTVGVVGTFAVGWLMPRLKAFGETHPFVELRLLTHDNLFDLASEGLDFAIRFGAGIWPATHNTLLLDAPLAALCAPHIARRLATPADLAGEVLLRPYRADDERPRVRFIAFNGGSRGARRGRAACAARHVRARNAGRPARAGVRHRSEDR